MAAAFLCGTGLLFSRNGHKGNEETTTCEEVMTWDLRGRLMTALRGKFRASGLG